MKQKRLSQTYNLVNDKMAISFGTVNKTKPQVVFITAGCWIYSDAIGNHKQYLIDLENTIRKLIKDYLLNDGLFSQRFILDYDVCLDNIFRRKRFVNIEVFLKQNSTTVHTVKELLPSVTERTTNLVDELIDELESNDFTVTKKK